MECVDFTRPRWPSRISTFNSIFCRSFHFGTKESVAAYENLASKNIVRRGVRPESPSLCARRARPYFDFRAKWSAKYR